jgi:hypothetical protein
MQESCNQWVKGIVHHGKVLHADYVSPHAACAVLAYLQVAAAAAGPALNGY